jgi:hypothetical protein
VTTAFDHLEQRICQMTIPAQTYHAPQPQARRNHHRQTDPWDHLPSFPSDLIRLHVLEIELASHDLILMKPLAMPARSLLPPGYRSFIHLQRMNDGLHGTSIGQQRHHDHDQFFWFA